MDDYFYGVVYFILGAVLGSFANVLILRIPSEKSIVPGSECMSCHKKIRWFHNIPIFSWLMLRGRCSYCKAPFSVQYMIVELTMACLFFAAHFKFHGTWFFYELLIFIFAAVTASFIDLKHYILPDIFTLGGLAIALIGSLLNPERHFLESLIGFFVGGGFLYATAYLHFLIRKIEGMGGGDIKLMAWIGALLGWQSIFFVLFAASIAGVIIGVILALLFNRSLKEPLPFGPFLIISALLFIFFDVHTMVQSLPSVFTTL